MTITHLKQDEVAARLKISPRTFERWRVTGEVNLPFLKVGGRVRYRLEDIVAFEERQLRTHTPRLPHTRASSFASRFSRSDERPSLAPCLANPVKGEPEACSARTCRSL